MPRAKLATDYHALAAARGLDWLGNAPPGTQRLTAWRCRAQGHVFERTYNLIQVIQRCPLCVGRVRKTPADYAALGSAHGLIWLGPEVATTRALTAWRCAAGHIFAARYTTVQQGSGCPTCARRAPKTSDDYAALGRAHGLIWQGSRAGPTRLKTDWRCAAGHDFRASYNGVQAGHGCPHCAGNARRTVADYRRTGRAHGLTWVGPAVPATSEPTGWRCRRGHVWTTTLATVRRGHGCPACRPPRRGPDDYIALARERGLTWLGPLPRSVKARTHWRCLAVGHVFETRYNLLQRGTGCPHCAGHGRKTPGDYRALARSRGWDWLGPKVAYTQEKTAWRCQQGHRFHASFQSAHNGHGCPRCAGNAPKSAADYRALARARRLRWAGRTLPRTVSVKTTWECSLGHRWQARYNTIQQGSGCPQCARPPDPHAPATKGSERRRRARRAP